MGSSYSDRSHATRDVVCRLDRAIKTFQRNVAPPPTPPPPSTFYFLRLSKKLPLNTLPSLKIIMGSLAPVAIGNCAHLHLEFVSIF